MQMVTPRPSVAAARNVSTYSGEPVTGIPRGTSPGVLNTSYTIVAAIAVPQGGAEGMIVTAAGGSAAVTSTCSMASPCSCGICSI